MCRVQKSSTPHQRTVYNIPKSKPPATVPWGNGISQRMPNRVYCTVYTPIRWRRPWRFVEYRLRNSVASLLLPNGQTSLFRQPVSRSGKHYGGDGATIRSSGSWSSIASVTNRPLLSPLSRADGMVILFFLAAEDSTHTETEGRSRLGLRVGAVVGGGMALSMQVSYAILHA